MTIWRKPVSWSKFRLALDCPQSLLFTLENKPVIEYPPNYYAELGKIVQYVFEVYFNQGVNLRPGGDKIGVVEKVLDKVLKSDYFQLKKITYPLGKTEAMLIAAVTEHVRKGFVLFHEQNLLNKPLKSEVKWNAVFHSMRMFAMIDFLYDDNGHLELYDGKGHSKKGSADIRQLLYYGLAIVAAGRSLKRGGFLYWQHGFEEVDVSAKALKEFADGPFKQGQKVIQMLQVGVDSLAPTPSTNACRYCPWKLTCTSSMCLKPEIDSTIDRTGVIDVSFGGVSG